MDFVIQAPMTLLEALHHCFPQSSRRTLQHWIRGGRFYIDSKRALFDSQPLRSGQVVHSSDVFCKKKIANIAILHEDRHFLIIDKPNGLLSVPLDDSVSKNHALGILRDHYQTHQIFAVHRLDREASGILLFARGIEAQKKFDILFEQHDVEREYFAILEGRLAADRGTWKSYLKELPTLNVETVHNINEGKEAITHFKVLRRSAKYSYLSITLETGRKHQIRVHCKDAACPIVGDSRYGFGDNPIRRLCLHAGRLSFQHPFTGQIKTFTSPIPSVFKKLGVAQDFLAKNTNEVRDRSIIK
jgi:23S rRNA pseudouridine1911/1915/1917 synthase